MTEACAGDHPFVGRVAELRAMAKHVAAARGGGGRVVIVTGEAGIGKTRLVEEARAPLPRARVVWGQCHDAECTPAFWPWTQVLRRYVEAVPTERLRAELAHGGGGVVRLVPAARTRVPGIDASEIDGVEPGTARFRLFDALKEFFRAIAAEEPLAVVPDDLHWADIESLLLLAFLGPELRGAKLLVVGTYRDWEMRQTTSASRVLADLARTSHRVALGGLGEPETAAYVRARAAAEPARELVAAIHRATAGNAFFLTEVIDLLARDGRLTAGAALDRIDLPDGVRGAVRRRVEPLPADARRMLAAAAVLGQEFDVGVLGRMLGASPDEILDRLGPAAARLRRPGRRSRDAIDSPTDSCRIRWRPISRRPCAHGFTGVRRRRCRRYTARRSHPCSARSRTVSGEVDRRLASSEQCARDEEGRERQPSAPLTMPGHLLRLRRRPMHVPYRRNGPRQPAGVCHWRECRHVDIGLMIHRFSLAARARNGR